MWHRDRSRTPAFDRFVGVTRQVCTELSEHAATRGA